MRQIVLIANDHLALPAAGPGTYASEDQQALLGTLLANMAYFGYTPSLEALRKLRAVDRNGLIAFWQEVEPAFEALTGADRRMAEFVVYRNFPQEVLEMSQAQYWVNQVLMYLGAPNEWFTQEPDARPALEERLTLKVLAPAGDTKLDELYRALVAAPSRWTDAQQTHALWLLRELGVAHLDLAEFGFKENGIVAIAQTLDLEGSVAMADATDVLRLAAVLSGASASLRDAVKLRSFSREERRLLLALLDNTRNLRADMALRPVLWKRLLARLHPGDFKFRNVIEAYHALYSGELKSFDAGIEAKLHAKDASVLTDLVSRPGTFARRLHSVYALFGTAAVDAFAGVTSKLGTSQLLKLRGYLLTINARKNLIYPPRGNWSKANFVANTKVAFAQADLAKLLAAIDGVLRARMHEALPQGVAVAEDTADIKLATNDQELAPYGRGTVFHIPANVTFLRSASYWAESSSGNTWFDNGWLAYGENWQPLGACCWNEPHGLADGAVFSGDPTNSKDLEGRATQMIDLHLGALAKQGVRYLVWNILCFSRKPFADADDVLASLQWGEVPEQGELYEPSRAQMVFPLKGKALTKYIAYVDIVERRLVYMDANLGGEVNSAASNLVSVGEKMPAFVEYLASLPSVADLFSQAPKGETPVLYSDAGCKLEPGATAYVFQPVNAENAFKPLRLEELL